MTSIFAILFCKSRLINCFKVIYYCAISLSLSHLNLISIVLNTGILVLSCVLDSWSVHSFVRLSSSRDCVCVFVCFCTKRVIASGTAMLLAGIESVKLSNVFEREIMKTIHPSTHPGSFDLASLFFRFPVLPFTLR